MEAGIRNRFPLLRAPTALHRGSSTLPLAPAQQTCTGQDRTLRNMGSLYIHHEYGGDAYFFPLQEAAFRGLIHPGRNALTGISGKPHTVAVIYGVCRLQYLWKILAKSEYLIPFRSLLQLSLSPLQLTP